MIISGIYPPDSGGPAMFSKRFAAWISNHKLEVVIVSYGRDKSVNFELPNIKVVILSRQSRLFIRYIVFIWTLIKSVRRNMPILVVGAFLETYFASLIKPFDYVVKVPGDIVWERAKNNGLTDLDINQFQFSKLSLKYKLFRAIFTQSLKRAQTVIVPSNGLRELCLGWGIDERRLVLIHNSIEVSPLLQNDQSDLSFDLLTVCRLTLWKGVDELIHYAASNNRTLVVAGDGPERENLENLTKELGANVTFLGDVPHDEVLGLFRKSKVFVLNSYYEGLPHALIEARANKILSVARAGTGSQEVIHDDVDGMLVRQDRNLEKTLNLVFSGGIDINDFIRRAHKDTENRFNQESNFELTIRILEKKSK